VNDLVDPTETAADRRRYAGVLVGLLAGAAAEGVLLAHVRRYAALLPLLTTLAVIGAACISFWAPERSSRLADAR
jgi:hypothetical protein